MTPRVRTEWRNRVAAEYRSAALTAQVLHWGIVAALPPDLLEVALRIVRDELAHAELSHGCLVALGGGDEPVPLDVQALVEPVTDGILGGLVDSVACNFCLGESLAVPLFERMRRNATHPAVRPVVTRVLKDEAVHRQFGWDALDALLAREPGGVRARVAARLPGWLAAFRDAYAPEGELPALTAEELGCGLIDLPAYRELFWTTVRGDIGRQFTRRGIEPPEGFR